MSHQVPRSCLAIVAVGIIWWSFAPPAVGRIPERELGQLKGGACTPTEECTTSEEQGRCTDCEVEVGSTSTKCTSGGALWICVAYSAPSCTKCCTNAATNCPGQRVDYSDQFCSENTETGVCSRHQNTVTVENCERNCS